MKKCGCFMLLSVLLTSCVTDDGGCGCVTPPGPDERLVVSLKNEDGDNLLLPNAFGYVSEEQLTFYLLTAERTINLTQAQRNNSIISEYISDTDGSIIKNIYLSYSWYMKNNNGTKEGSYVIDYNGLYPNDTIFTKYSVTEWKESDKLLEVKVNGVLQQTDSLNDIEKGIVIVK